MSARLPGTREARRALRNKLYSAHIVYGTSLFGSLTPSHRHSGLTLRLMRFRRNDPFMSLTKPCACVGKCRHQTEWQKWIGKSSPSLDVSCHECTEVDLPEYDVRKVMGARDPLSSVDAFHDCRSTPCQYYVRISRHPYVAGEDSKPCQDHCKLNTEMQPWGSSTPIVLQHTGPRCPQNIA